MTVELDEERGAQVHKILTQGPDAGGCVMQLRSSLVLTRACVHVHRFRSSKERSLPASCSASMEE